MPIFSSLRETLNPGDRLAVLVAQADDRRLIRRGELDGPS